MTNPLVAAVVALLADGDPRGMTATALHVALPEWLAPSTPVALGRALSGHPAPTRGHVGSTPVWRLAHPSAGTLGAPSADPRRSLGAPPAEGLTCDDSAPTFRQYAPPWTSPRSPRRWRREPRAARREQVAEPVADTCRRADAPAPSATAVAALPALLALFTALGDEPSPCAAAPEVWTSDAPDDVLVAQQGCHGCSARRECFAYATASGATAGVWAGQDMTPRDARRRPTSTERKIA